MYQIGIDVGGTFTDFVLRDMETGAETVKKVPSTPADPSEAGVNGIRALAGELGFPPEEIARVLHGTTIATNILLQRNGARVGLITTDGFRDILHIGRKKRPLNFSNYQDIPRQSSPIVPRDLRLTVRERVRAPDGAVETPLDEDQAIAAIDRLAAAGVDAIAVCFLFSFLNPAHEVRVRQLARSRHPDMFLTCSHEVTPLHREYERFSTAALNAYVGPATGTYTDRFTAALGGMGIQSDLRLMTSAGGLIGSRVAKEKPVTLLLSGPVAALKKGVEIGNKSGQPNVITLDVGGTSADIGVSHGGAMRLKHVLDTRIGDYDAMVPMVDLATIGAGGGSIAFIDEGGMFRVGPRSAGARPGPVCYGSGGTEPTVTDALVCLGWFREKILAAAGIAIDRVAAEKAVEEKIAGPLGIDLPSAALGIYRIAAKNMIDAISLQSISKGYDPRDFALVPFGGAGPAFAAEIARELSISRTVIPPHPGVGAAAGLLSTDIRYEHMRSLWSDLETVDTALVLGAYEEMRHLARAELSQDGFASGEIAFVHQADCRYAGQGYELTVEADDDPTAKAWRDQVAGAFHREHKKHYLRSFEDKSIQLINLRLIGIGANRPGKVGNAGPARQGVVRAPEMAPAVFPSGSKWTSVETAFYQREALDRGTVIDGPAIVEQTDATIVIPPSVSARHDAAGHLILEARH